MNHKITENFISTQRSELIKEDIPRINTRKKALIDELYGFLEGTDITLEELKKERLKKYEL